MLNWLKRVLGSTKTGASDSPPSVDSGLPYVDETVHSHLKRLRAHMTDPTMKAILDEVEERCLENAWAIRSMVQQTLSDRKLHTKAILGGGVRTFLVVSSIPRDRSNAAAFFASEYPPGYGGYANFWLNSQPAQTAITLGHTVIALLLVYADRSIGLGLTPLDPNNLGACPKIVLPEESLTQEDRRLMGM